jgi:hypothetical protein
VDVEHIVAGLPADTSNRLTVGLFFLTRCRCGYDRWSYARLCPIRPPRNVQGPCHRHGPAHRPSASASGPPVHTYHSNEPATLDAGRFLPNEESCCVLTESRDRELTFPRPQLSVIVPFYNERPTSAACPRGHRRGARAARRSVTRWCS